MTIIASRLSFYAALVLSSVLTLMLLSAAANFGFGQVTAAGPAALIVVIMLLNPVIFGLLGFIKGSPRWQMIAAGAMMTLLLLYALLVFGYFGPISG